MIGRLLCAFGLHKFRRWSLRGYQTWSSHCSRPGCKHERSYTLRFWLPLLALLVASPAFAEGGQFGGCFAGEQLCAAPAVAVTVGEYNLTTGRFAGGVSPGIGYGLTYRPDRWYATGLAAYLAFSVGGSEPNSAAPALLLSFANYVRLGVGMLIREQAAPEWRLLFGIGVDFGGSPSYVRAAAKGAP